MLDKLSWYLTFVILTALILAVPFLKYQPTAYAGAPDPQEVLKASQPIHTTSRFETKLESTSEDIAFDTQYKDDPDREAGDDQTVQEGKLGKKTTITKITLYMGQEYDREIVSTEVEDPTPKIISRGTKIVWRDIAMPDGTVHYWKKMHVYATHYDSHCPGCNDTTTTGMKAGKGVIAVDPRVIKLGSRVYVPGYGFAIAGDTGGAIKGNIIDLGFEDAHTAGWTAHFVDIYLL